MVLHLEQHLGVQRLHQLTVDDGVISSGVFPHQVHGSPIILTRLAVYIQPGQILKIGGQFVTGLERGLEDLYGIPAMMQDALGMPALGLTYEPAPQRAFLTVRFEGAYQAGMSPREEQRITTAMVSELRRQGVALATR